MYPFKKWYKRQKTVEGGVVHTQSQTTNIETVPLKVLRHRQTTLEFPSIIYYLHNSTSRATTIATVQGREGN